MSPDTEVEAADAASEAVEPAGPVDEARQAVVAEFTEELGDAVVGSFVRPGDDIWIRVTREAWRTAGFVLRDKAGFRAFEFLSVIDWLPSPFGKNEDSPTDAPPTPSSEIVTGYAGGDTRFQVFARAHSLTRKLGVTLKVDLPDDDLSIDTWLPVYAGVNWHEREAHEMFGIGFTGHPHLAHLYLPGEFEGFPLRKTFPLLARHVKPWPGIVDVEPMPAEADGDAEAEATPDAEAAE
ncbi:NADH-quinone oxidoreductase subunit C [Aquihabitans sp. G128]|uniref:NADH-quinone oxidoreductase subunit C n=1 Tax=Aquihabitans sp. G128 TaxID=2849779 RepID=UPI001C24ED3A|nr:NADH-quinone oxidoreductase subunit C [Aquihabitans sp. G128]QXC60186.1 NADH-quinone oxidoreductase subunit C [Aquihabitans sp. G128]